MHSNNLHMYNKRNPSYPTGTPRRAMAMGSGEEI